MILVMLAAAAATAPLPPRGKWTVEYADSACMLSRQFGNDDKGPVLAIKPWPIGSDTEFVLLTYDDRRPKITGTVTVTLQPANVPADARFIRGSTANHTKNMAMFAFADHEIGSLPAARSIDIAIDRSERYSLRLDGIDRAMSALQGCQADLLRSWKVPQPALETLTSPAVPVTDARTWVTSADYPPMAMYIGDAGVTGVVWQIGIDGRAHDCRVVVSSGRALLDNAPCPAILSRARYRPAIATDGKPVVTYDFRRVLWSFSKR